MTPRWKWYLAAGVGVLVLLAIFWRTGAFAALLAGLGIAGAAFVPESRETDARLSEMKTTINSAKILREGYERGVEKIEKDIGAAGVDDLVSRANKHERRRDQSE